MKRGKLFSAGRMSRTNIHKSRKQESEVAEAIGGDVTSGSGNQWHSKGDVTSPAYLVECKTKQRHTLTNWWKKIKAEALIKGKEPVIQLNVDGFKLAIIDFEQFIELTEK